MQTMGVTGKIYNLKQGQTQNGKSKVTFRVGVRKRYVSDQDKQNNKTMTFMPMIAMGPTADFINQYFKDGDTIAIGDMEFQTYRTQNAPNEFDDAHIFKVDKVGFVPGANDNNGGGNQQNNNQQRSNNQGGGYNQNQGGGYGGGYNNNQQPPAPAGAPAGGGGGYQPQDDLPF